MNYELSMPTAEFTALAKQNLQKQQYPEALKDQYLKYFVEPKNESQAGDISTRRAFQLRYTIMRKKLIERLQKQTTEMKVLVINLHGGQDTLPFTLKEICDLRGGINTSNVAYLELDTPYTIQRKLSIIKKFPELQTALESVRSEFLKIDFMKFDITKTLQIVNLISQIDELNVREIIVYSECGISLIQSEQAVLLLQKFGSMPQQIYLLVVDQNIPQGLKEDEDGKVKEESWAKMHANKLLKAGIHLWGLYLLPGLDQWLTKMNEINQASDRDKAQLFWEAWTTLDNRDEIMQIEEGEDFEKKRLDSYFVLEAYNSGLFLRTDKAHDTKLQVRNAFDSRFVYNNNNELVDDSSITSESIDV